MKPIAAVLAVSALLCCVTAAGAASGRTVGGATTVHVLLGKPSEMRFTFDRTSVPHGAVVFQLTNSGLVAHDLRIDGSTSNLVAPGGKTTLAVTFAKAGLFRYGCTVPGHAAAGMKGVLKVT